MKILKGCLKLFASLIFSIFLLLLAVGSFFGVKGYNLYQSAVSQTPIPEKVESIRSMDNFTEFEELPKTYVNAVVSVEDKRFWSHHGVDCLAIARAVWNDIRSFSLAEGGSTITQQLMKNEYFTQEKTFERKFAEIFAAWNMENTFEKTDILELYVNTIYFGSGYYGIYDAAQGYFGKTPAELTDAEAILLAGLPNAPSVYSPNSNPDLAKQRMKQVLNRMVDCQLLTEENADKLFAEV